MHPLTNSSIIQDLGTSLGTHTCDETLDHLANSVHTLDVGHGWSSWCRRAAKMGVSSIQFVDIDPLDATLRFEKGTYRICINSKRPRTRQIFSLAHELAHVAMEQRLPYLASDLKNRSLFVTDFNEEEEALANSLAARMLMPRKTVSQIVSEFGNGIGAIQEMTRTFGTSVQAASRRITEVGERIACLLFRLEQNAERLRFRSLAAWNLPFLLRLFYPWMLCAKQIGLRPSTGVIQRITIGFPVSTSTTADFECEARCNSNREVIVATSMAT